MEPHASQENARLESARRLLALFRDERAGLMSSDPATPAAVATRANAKMGLLEAFAPGFLAGEAGGADPAARRASLSELKSIFEQLLVIDQENTRLLKSKLDLPDALAAPRRAAAPPQAMASRQNLPFLPGMALSTFTAPAPMPPPPAGASYPGASMRRHAPEQPLGAPQQRPAAVATVIPPRGQQPASPPADADAAARPAPRSSLRQYAACGKSGAARFTA